MPTRSTTCLIAVPALVLAGVAACGTPAPPAPAPATATSAPTAPASTGSGPTGSGPTGSVPVTTFDHVPLWPFADADEVHAWQEAYRTGGHQPWHLDASATAEAFAGGYLGFTGIDRTTTVSTVGDDAWIGLGYALPDGRDATAAELHLARFGTGEDAPWEVVGTRDDTLVLDTPRYGSTVRTPITVGGTITGVDESLRVRILGHDGGTIGESCCLPAGGEDSRWSVTVPVVGDPPPGALTVVVSTGGHVADVERFAITGVRVP